MSVTGVDPDIQQFADYSKTQSGLAAKTADDYASDVRSFAKHFGAGKRLRNAQQRDIVGYIAHLTNRGLKASTIGRKYFAIKAFYQHLSRQGVPHSDPWHGVKLPEERRGENRAVLTRDEVFQALNATGGRNAARDRAILALYYSGLKRAEVCAMNLRDLALEKKQCTIAERVVTLSDDITKRLNDYLTARPRGGGAQSPLFVTVNGGRLTDRHAWHVAQKAGLRAGIASPVSPESLRLAYGVHAIEDGRNPIDVAATLGIDMSGIQNYVRLAKRDSEGAEAFALTGMSSVDLDDLDMRHANQAWHKILQRLPYDAEGAITATRTLLETISRRILTSAGNELPERDNLSGWTKRALTVVLPVDEDVEYYKQFARIACGLVDHIATYRNLHGDAHAPKARRNISSHQVRYAVALASSTFAFLRQCYEDYLERTSTKAPSSQGERVLAVTPAEQRVLQLLLQGASRSSTGSKKTTYTDILRMMASNRRAGHNGNTFVRLSLQESRLLYDLIPSEDVDLRVLGNAGSRVRRKLEGLISSRGA